MNSEIKRMQQLAGIMTLNEVYKRTPEQQQQLFKSIKKFIKDNKITSADQLKNIEGGNTIRMQIYRHDNTYPDDLWAPIFFKDSQKLDYNDYDTNKEIASQYNSATEYANGKRLAWEIAKRNGWLEDFFPNYDTSKSAGGPKYTSEENKEIFNTIKQFVDKNNIQNISQLHSFSKRGAIYSRQLLYHDRQYPYPKDQWVDRIFDRLDPEDYKTNALIASNYPNVSAFEASRPKFWKVARDNGWLDKFKTKFWQ
jgi:hypothetical protein